MEITKLELEVERLEEEVIKHESIISNSECEIKKLINTYDDPVERQRLIEKWTSEINIEEKKSNEIWGKKKIFFEKNQEFDNNKQQPPRKHAPPYNNYEKPNKFSHRRAYNMKNNNSFQNTYKRHPIDNHQPHFSTTNFHNRYWRRNLK